MGECVGIGEGAAVGLAVGLVGRAVGRGVGADFTVGIALGLKMGAGDGRAANIRLAPAAPTSGGEAVAFAGADAGVE